MAIESAKFYKDNLSGENVAILFVDNGVTKSVGINATDNMDYQAIQEWVADGNTIEEAD